MKYVKLYMGSDNQSHFEELSMELFDAKYGKMSEAVKVNQVIFGEMDEPRVVDWHNPPQVQYIIMLKGSMEIEIGDGTKKIFNEGDILLAADTTGQGHITRAASEGTRLYMLIPVA